MSGWTRRLLVRGLGVVLLLSSCARPETPVESDLRIIFVYNADASLLRRAHGVAQKLFAPERYECRLCSLTHELTGERKEWSEFLESLPYPKEFLHRDEWVRLHPGEPHLLPAIYLQEGDADPLPLIISTEFDAFESLEELRHTLLRRLGQRIPQAPEAGGSSYQI